MTQTTDDGFSLKASLNGESRTLARAGSGYELSSSNDSKHAQEEAQKITTKLNDNLKPLLDGLASLKTIKARLAEPSNRELPFYDLKQGLRSLAPELFSQYGLDMANSHEELIRMLNSAEVRITTNIDELEARASEQRTKLITEMKSKAKEKDSIKKSTLKFFAQIGFDQFSQEETDSVFKWLNANPVIGMGL